MRLPIDTVLLLIGLQEALDDPRWRSRDAADVEARLAALLDAWRELALPVLHVRHDSVDPASPYRPGQKGNGFKAAFAPQPGEGVVVARTGSAFVGTGLEETLTQGGNTTLVVCGVFTQHAVSTTVRHAGCLGFRAFVPGDACRAFAVTDWTGRTWPEAEVHSQALAALHGEYARVVDTHACLAAASLARAWNRAKRQPS